jgi:SAM-dependent methyltransferase
LATQEISPTAIVAVCPRCRGNLDWSGAAIGCLGCGAAYTRVNGFPDLIVGGRFDDEADAARSTYETASNEYLTTNYLLPTFRRRLGGIKSPRILSLGCGVGIDVDLLTEEGWDMAGIDCGNRTVEWPARRYPQRLYLANGKALPFEDHTFDLVYCGCVFPHVGVDGDSNRVLPNYREERLRIAKEMTRVLKPGGSIMVSSPNRMFPLDLFHGRSEKQPLPRWNPPTSRFLLSAGDYRGLFGEAGCTEFQLQPVNGYWGFLRKNQSLKGRVVTWPVRGVFNLVSSGTFGFLRGSVVSPWLVMMMRAGIR